MLPKLNNKATRRKVLALYRITGMKAWHLTTEEVEIEHMFMVTHERRRMISQLDHYLYGEQDWSHTTSIDMRLALRLMRDGVLADGPRLHTAV